MTTTSVILPQPLTGIEIKRGIASRMTRDCPDDVREDLKERIVTGLGKTCSLVATAAYAKFKATWELAWWWEGDELRTRWQVGAELNDFGRLTPVWMHDHSHNAPPDAQEARGTIDYTPPDKFRRETDQPVPRPTELKPAEPDRSTFSKAMKGPGKRRKV